MNLGNRRYAFLGWIVWSVFKGYLRQRAKAAAPAVLPSVDLAARRPNRAALAVAFALAVGIGTFVALRLRDGAEAESL